MSRDRDMRDILLTKYADITGLERTLIQLIALFHEPISRTMLAKLVTEMEDSPLGRKLINSGEMTQLLKPLTEDGLLRLIEGHDIPFYECSQDIEWEVMLDVQKEGLIHKMEQAIGKHAPAGSIWQGEYQRLISYPRFVRELRISLLNDRQIEATQLLSLAERQFPKQLEEEDPIVKIFGDSHRHEWLTHLSDDIQKTILTSLIHSAIERVSDLSPLITLVDRQLSAGNATLIPFYRHWKVVLDIVSGDFSRAEQVLCRLDPIESPLCLQGWILALRGDGRAAITHFERELKHQRKIQKSRDVFLKHPSGLFFLLALLESKDAVDHKKAEKHLLFRDLNRIPFSQVYEVLWVASMIRSNRIDSAVATQLRLYANANGLPIKEDDIQDQDRFIDYISPPHEMNLKALFLMLGFQWTMPRVIGSMYPYLEQFRTKALSNGHRWVVDTLDGLFPDRSHNPTWNPAALIVYKAPWEYGLEALESHFVESSSPAANVVEVDHRLVWWIGMGEWGVSFSIQPRIQKRSANGTWSKGRNIALQRLNQEIASMPWLTEQDLRVCGAIRKYWISWGRAGYELDMSKAILALVGHPLVFWEESPTFPIEVVQSDPGLLIEEKEGLIHLTMAHPMKEEGLTVIKESINRCNIIQVGPQHAQLSSILGEKGLVVPVEEKERIHRLLGPLSDRVEIETNLSGANDHLPEIPSNFHLHVHLQPHNDGLMARLLVRPFGHQGPYHAPGQGNRILISEIDRKRQQTHRDLVAEEEEARRVVQHCPSLSAPDETWRWVIDDPEACLELLYDLRTLADQVTILWPEGETMKISHTLSMENLSLKTSGDSEWFYVEGKIHLPNGEVMEMKALLDAINQQKGRFIPLGDGQFLALTRTFKKRLEALSNVAEKKGRGQRYHHLMLPVLNDLMQDVGNLETHGGWQERLQALEQAQSKKPRLPRTFEADLRPYQQEGFKWMYRLAAWGAGACLADDMGLGKTLQSLALLITRATEGPALVVAPTSVCMNWVAEATRFAPTLNMILFNAVGDRESALAELKPFDVLVCSYTLLQLESDPLQKVSWQTVLLDEAQAIKNPAAKRTKAAFALSAPFRLATTGTPIENHLVELWSLFRFLNPGLLGSRESFIKRFATPIERGDDAVKNQLKRILNPFILRRTKNQVLEDLPPKTEITLHVSMEGEEASLYEALRLSAMEKLAAVNADDNQQRLNVLAEITRLRRACCHPSLVMPEKQIEGAKLKVFSEVVDELRENDHRALVFSQFVDHLSIIRRHLDQKKIPYHYLDGTTPANKRQELVNRFQNGEGDLFLISLKAGGFGLNLTGADYVIHMDPWWNPAVEDQASDRAHRIGQTRPVTIYRLVTENTIEDKIVALHHKKRDLASNLLDGTHKSERLTTEVLLQLIRG